MFYRLLFNAGTTRSHCVMKSNDNYSQIKTNFTRAKVLVVDDNDDQWLLISQAMQQCLSEVTAVRVASPAEAMTLLEEWQMQEWEIPKLILLDLYLPDNQDGWGLLKQIKTMPAPINRVPVVMLSASVNSDDITMAYQLGVSSYLVKPVSYADWLNYFQELRTFWWETATLPPIQFMV